MTYHLDGTGYYLAASGAYSLSAASSIPPAEGGLIEGFEHNDYANEYSGDTADFNIASDDPRTGTYHLDSDGGESMIFRDTADGEMYQTHEYTARFHQFGGTTAGLCLFVDPATTGFSDMDGYIAAIDFGFSDEIEMFRVDAGTKTSLGSTALAGQNTKPDWNDLVVSFDTNGDWSVDYYEEGATSPTASLSGNDSTYTSGKYGWYSAQSGSDYDDLEEN